VCETSLVSLLDSARGLCVRTLLIGGRGQLGTALRGQLPGDVVSPDRGQLDLTDEAQVAERVRAERPQLVINAAAYNLVDRAEDEPEIAFQQNAFALRHLAREVDAIGAMLVQVSTDHVFGLEGSPGHPWRENDLPGPVSVYGASKLTGEFFARTLCSRHLIVRTCGLYGVADSPGKGNFVGTMLRLGRQQREVRVVDDQHCTPTRATDLARAIVDLVAAGTQGLFHITNAGATTWCGFAREIFRLAGISTPVIPIRSSEFAAKARRPAWSVLSGDKLASQRGVAMPGWNVALAEYLAERGELHRG
jgi:dTDP-4-dehydrorhamnose reductase